MKLQHVIEQTALYDSIQYIVSCMRTLSIFGFRRFPHFVLLLFFSLSRTPAPNKTSSIMGPSKLASEIKCRLTSEVFRIDCHHNSIILIRIARRRR